MVKYIKTIINAETGNQSTIYISGPMTGLPELNCPAFHAAEKKLLALGYNVINPAKNKLPGNPSWSDFMDKSIYQVFKSDAVGCLPGWEKSKGARIEVEIAKQLGLAIIEPF